ncbi:MAG: hypothetical protein H7256_09180 [Bdellovibrio sp.]|nr:hypothetical protein [Bdellovibrio sp.]
MATHAVGMPYSEFMADAFAAILSNDPKIISARPGFADLGEKGVRDFTEALFEPQISTT